MDDLLEQGIAAYKTGKRDEAWKIFIALVKQEPDNERAWGWMYMVANDNKERIYCMKQALRINPANEKAKQILDSLTGQDFPFEVSQKNAMPTQEQKHSVPPDIRSNNEKKSKSAGVYLATGIGVTLIIGIFFVGVWFVLQNQGMLNFPTTIHTLIATPKPLKEFSHEDLRKSTLTTNDLTFGGLYMPNEWVDCSIADNIRSDSKTNSELAFKTFETTDCPKPLGGSLVIENIFLLKDIEKSQRLTESLKYEIIDIYKSNMRFIGVSYVFSVSEISKDGYEFWILQVEGEPVQFYDLVVQVDEVVIKIFFSGFISRGVTFNDLAELGSVAIEKMRSVQRQSE